jgi:hypothetical protein
MTSRIALPWSFQTKGARGNLRELPSLGLEDRYGVTPIVGSNPTPSA